MNLPVDFVEKFKNLLSAKEFESFIKSFNASRNFGLRANTLKISVEEFKKILPYDIVPIPWTQDGFYYNGNESPGKHPYYFAGLYYIQEPSAMLPATLINPKPGEKVLDLCAAPGGKTVQMAAMMKGEGQLISNDINKDRVKALVKNIELCGVRNSIVTNETPLNLSKKFVEFFDKILVDAPCSGEGMFRKDVDSIKSYKKYKSEILAKEQYDILEHAAKMLTSGGKIIYSTCTFSPEENEQVIERFLEKHDDYQVEKISKNFGIDDGRPEWANGREDLKNTARLWPQKLKGEGHFIAVLKKNEMPTDERYKKIKKDELPDAFLEFQNQYLNTKVNGYFCINGKNLYNLPIEFPDLSRIKVAKFGRFIGSIEKNRFEPSHSFCIALKKDDFKNCINLSADSNEVKKYLKGETLLMDGENGYVLILVDGYSLGLGKRTDGVIKNLYPKGWRMMN